MERRQDLQPLHLHCHKDLTLEAEFRSTTAVENVSADTPAPRKILRNGQVLILRDGKIFTPTGVEVR